MPFARICHMPNQWGSDFWEPHDPKNKVPCEAVLEFPTLWHYCCVNDRRAPPPMRILMAQRHTATTLIGLLQLHPNATYDQELLYPKI